MGQTGIAGRVKVLEDMEQLVREFVDRKADTTDSRRNATAAAVYNFFVCRQACLGKAPNAWVALENGSQLFFPDYDSKDNTS